MLLTHEQIAQLAHEANRAYCEALGDMSQVPWAQAPEWQRSSAVNGVIFHETNPEASPSASHDSWLKQKTEEGWKYGPEKDANQKTHPCFRPYEELPVEQRAKDYIFRAVVRTALELNATVKVLHTT
jgi:RyR domain